MVCRRYQCFANDSGNCEILSEIIPKKCPFFKTNVQFMEARDEANANRYESKIFDCWKVVYDKKGKFLAAECTVCGHFFHDEKVTTHKICPDCKKRVEAME